MDKRILLWLLILPVCLPALAGGGEYAVSNIPAPLLKNANAVKRMEQIRFEVVNSGEAILTKKYAITILNENGDHLAAFVEYYDKLHEIRNIEGALFDADGKELKRLRNKQVLDLTGSDDNNLADDNRRKAHHFFYKVYPYTVQYEVEIRYNGTLFFPVWLPREEEYLAVERSSFTISTGLAYVLRHKAFNYTGGPAESTDKNKKIYTWQIQDLPAVTDEYASPGWYKVNTAVFTGPSEFEIEKYRGTMNNWLEFGKFVYSLKQGRDQLPEQVKQAVRQQVSGVNDTKEKIERLYAYLQKNTRYISIQLGIGGWQPFDAAYVAAKAYGDCKALTNYMYSLLKEAGIASCYTLVRAGRGAGDILADFPSQQFNHVILAVPLKNDTVWLECTSQTLPAGYLGDFTSDRYALMVTEDGGKLVRTPRYGLKENLQLRTVKAVLDEEATLSVSASTRYSGLQQDRYHDLIHQLSKEKVKEVLQEELDFASYDVNSFSYEEQPSARPLIGEKLGITVNNYATITGKRLFIVPNVMTRTKRKLPADVERKFDIELNVEYKDVDSVEISIPAGYTPEAMPKDVSLSSKFGNYECRTKLEGNKLFYYRTIEQYSGRYPASDYAELVKFYETIYKADRSKAVLVKNQ